MAPLLTSCDAALTCGGNTLYELACVGTPAVVFHEEAHERETARSFERLGFGVSAGSGADADCNRILAALAPFDDPAVRQTQCDSGKRLVDGRGTARILDIVRGVAVDRMAAR